MATLNRSATASAEELSDSAQQPGGPAFNGAGGGGASSSAAPAERGAGSVITKPRPRFMNVEPETFAWGVPELGKFFENCMPEGYNAYAQDGIHPKCLCSKICNDVLNTNININSGSSNPNDRILCFEVLQMLEHKFIEFKVIEAPRLREGAQNPNHMAYKRVRAPDLKKLEAHLPDGGRPGCLETWARGVVEECIAKLSSK